MDETAVRTRLLALKASLEARGAASGPAAPGGRARLPTMPQQDRLPSDPHLREVALERVTDALMRLSAGRYGECTRCGKEVEAWRLERDPAEPICSKCSDDHQQ